MVVLLYAFVHTMFNQADILEAFIQHKALLFKSPWVDWESMHTVVASARRTGQKTRSSNYRSNTL